MSHDYRQSALERIVGRRLADIDIGRARAPLAALAAVLIAVGLVAALETHRINQLDDQRAALRARIDTARTADARVTSLAQRVAKLEAIRDAIARSRKRTVTVTNAIARLGDGLPSSTWLTSIETTGASTWSIAGRSTGIDEVGTTLARIARLAPSASARLLSINAVGRRHRLLEFTIAWDNVP